MELTKQDRYNINIQIDILDVLDEFKIEVQKETGGRCKIQCPFHKGDNDPSLVIYTSQKPMTWYCFGCQKGTDALEFYRLISKKPLSEIVNQFLKNRRAMKTSEKLRMKAEANNRKSKVDFFAIKENLNISFSIKVRGLVASKLDKFDEIQVVLAEVDDFFSKDSEDLYELRSFLKKAEAKLRSL